MYEKNGTTYSFNDIQRENPNTSFAANGPNKEWLTENGYTEVVVAPQLHVVTEEEVVQNLTNAVQNHLDNIARSRMYDGILSLASYAGDEDSILNAEGTIGKAYRSACWRKALTIMEEVKAGTRVIPSEQELIAELPTITW